MQDFVFFLADKEVDYSCTATRMAGYDVGTVPASRIMYSLYPMLLVFTADYDDDDDDGVIDVSVTSSRNHGDDDVRDHQWRHSARYHHDNDRGLAGLLHRIWVFLRLSGFLLKTFVVIAKAKLS